MLQCSIFNVLRLSFKVLQGVAEGVAIIIYYIIGGVLMAQIDMNAPKRHFFGTLNNPDKKGYTPENFKEKLMTLKPFKYLVFQLECGESETPHYQFYIAFKSGVRGSTIKNLISEAHLEHVNHGNDNARNYCMKDEGRIDGPWEEGEFVSDTTKIGKVNKLNQMFKMILGGANLKDLMDYDASTYIKHQNQIDSAVLKYKSERYLKEVRNVYCRYIFGDAGTGKTNELLQEILDKKAYRAMGNNAFDDYFGQEHLVYDEFGGQVPLKQMLGILDIYPYQLECRYAKRIACYDKVTVISNDSILKQYENVQSENFGSYLAFVDRFKEIIKYEDKNPVGTPRNERWRNVDKIWYDYDIEFDHEQNRKVCVLREIKRIRIRQGEEIKLVEGKQTSFWDGL